MAIEISIKSKNKLAHKIGAELLSTVRRESYPNGNSGYRDESVRFLEENLSEVADFTFIHKHFRGNAVCVAFYYLVIADKLTPSNIKALRELTTWRRDLAISQGRKSGRI